MFHLLSVVISIALLAAMTAATINYIPAEATLTRGAQIQATAGFESMHTTVVNYLNDHRDAGGVIVLPGLNVNITSDLVPTYGFLPAKVMHNMDWEANTGQVYGLDAVGICLKPSQADPQRQAELLPKIQQTLPQGSSFISTACGGTSNIENGDHLTYWVILQHV